MSNASDFTVKDGVLEKYDGPAGDIIIPDGVHTIKDYAFAPWERAHSKTPSCITIPKTVKKIQSHWLSLSFTDITNINVSEENKFFLAEDGVLFDRKKQKLIRFPNAKPMQGEYRIPDSVTSINEDAFFGCGNISVLHIPASVRDMGKTPFVKCTMLTDIDVAEDNPFFCSVDGVLFNKEKTELIKYPLGRKEEYTIPKGTVSVRSLAFGCSKITSVIIPDGVTALASVAFSACEDLVSITLPDSLKKVSYGTTGEMQDSSFAYCRSIKNIRFIAGNATAEMHKMLQDTAFFGPIEPLTVQAPMIPLDKIHSKYKKAAALGFIDAVSDGFGVDPEIAKTYNKYISSQKKKMYPDLMKTPERIQYLTDNRLIPLADLDELLQTVGNDAQSKAMLLDYQKNSFSDKEKKTAAKKETAIPTVTSTNKAAFVTKKSADSSLVITMYKGTADDVVIPSAVGKAAVKVIGEESFYCYKTRRSEESQKACLNIKSITISEGIETVERSAFHSCKKLETITIPESVKTIRGCAFMECTKLQSVTIPNQVQTIEYMLFYGCKSLQTVTIPESVISIGENAFYGCAKLTVCAPAGSYAEQYAKENNIPFRAK